MLDTSSISKVTELHTVRRIYAFSYCLLPIFDALIAFVLMLLV